MRRFPRRWHRLACAAGLALAFGCGRTQPGRPSPDQMQAAGNRAEILQRAIGGKYRSRLGAAARQILAADPGSTKEAVVVVQLEPDSGSYRLSPRELDAGAVVGRFRKHSPGALRRFGLSVKDTLSYWYVSRDPEGQYLGRFVSDNMDTTYVITVEMHDQAEEGMEQVLPWRQAIAQFEYLGPLGAEKLKGKGDAGWLPAAEGGGGSAWVTCTLQGCCKVQ